MVEKWGSHVLKKKISEKTQEFEQVTAPLNKNGGRRVRQMALCYIVNLS